MSVAKQTINAYIQVRLNELEYKAANELSAVGLDVSGLYIADAQGNYVSSATNVKEAVHALDLQLYSVATTYAQMAATASTFTGVSGTPSELLNTLKKIGDSINNDASFASNYLSTIGGEIATATAADNQLRTDLSGEIIRSIPVEDLLRSDLAGQIIFATAADAQLTTDLSGEVVRATQVAADLLVAISDNISARIQAVNDLSTSVDNRLLDLSGTFYTGIANEVTRATTADNQILTDLSGEIQRSVTEDVSYRTDLSGEIIRASAADATLTTDLSGEVQRATAADEGLSGRVSTIETYYIPKNPALAEVPQNPIGVFNPYTMGADFLFYYYPSYFASLIEAGYIIKFINTDATEFNNPARQTVKYTNTANLPVGTKWYLWNDMTEVLRVYVEHPDGVTGSVNVYTAQPKELFTLTYNGDVSFTAKILRGKTATADFDLAGNKIVNLGAPSADGDATNKKYVDDSVSALGDVFSYRGQVNLSESNDLTLLSHKEKGAAYKIIGNGSVITNYLQENGIADLYEYSVVTNNELPGRALFIINNPLNSIALISGVNKMNLYGEGAWTVVDFTPGTQAAPVDISTRNVLTDYSNAYIQYKFTQNGYVTIYQDNPQTGQLELAPLQVFQHDILQLNPMMYELNPDNTQKVTTIDGVEYYTALIRFQTDFITKRAGPTLTAASNPTDGESVFIIDYTLPPGQYYREYTAGYLKYAPLEVVQQYQFNSDYIYALSKSGDSINLAYQPFLKSSIPTLDISSSTPSSPFICDSFENIQAINSIIQHGGQGVVELIKFSSHGYIEYRSNYWRNADGSESSGYGINTQEVNAGDYFIFYSIGDDSTHFSGRFELCQNLPVTSQPTSTITPTISYLYSSAPPDGLFAVNLTQSGYAGFSPSVQNVSEGMFVKNNDIVVSKGDGWDVLNNTDILVTQTSGRTAVSGDGLNGYTIDINSVYAGQSTLTTVGTVTTGRWQATTLATFIGGTGQTTYAAGDVLLGNSAASLDKLALGAQGTFLKSDGGNASWVPEDTANISLTSTTNFPTLATLQESLDSLYDSFQKRKIIQFVLQSSTDYDNATTPNVNLLSGKVNFINYDAGNTTIYLPPSSTEVVDGTIIRVVHNGDYSTSNMTIKYKDVDANTDVSVVEIAPHDTTAFVWNAASSSWLVGIGI